MFRNRRSQNERCRILLFPAIIWRSGFAVNWRGITHLTLIHCLTLGHLLSYIIDLFPKRGGQTFNSECREVSLMQRRCKEAEFSRGVGHSACLEKYLLYATLQSHFVQSERVKAVMYSSCV